MKARSRIYEYYHAVATPYPLKFQLSRSPFWWLGGTDSPGMSGHDEVQKCGAERPYAWKIRHACIARTSCTSQQVPRRLNKITSKSSNFPSHVLSPCKAAETWNLNWLSQLLSANSELRYLHGQACSVSVSLPVKSRYQIHHRRG